MTRRQEALNATRRRLPMVKGDKEYVLEGPDGKVTLAQLSGDKRQLAPPSPAEWRCRHLFAIPGPGL